MPDRNGKIFYTSITSLSHISKKLGNEAEEELQEIPATKDKLTTVDKSFFYN